MSDALESSAVERHVSTQQQAADILRDAMQPTPEVEETQEPAEAEVEQETVEEQPSETIEASEEPEQQPEEADVAIDTLSDLAGAIEVDNEFLYNIKVPMPDGQESVSISALKDAYQGKLESQSMTEVQLNEQRAQFEREQEEWSQQIAQQRAQIQQMPEEVLAAEAEVRAIASQYQSFDWEELEKVDPGRAALEKQNLATKYSQAEARANDIKQQLYTRQQQDFQKHVADQEKQILATNREWADQSVRTKEATEISEMMTQYGFNPNEIGNVGDHRTIKMLRDFIKMKSQFSQAETAKKTVMKTPKVLKPGAVKPAPGRAKKLQATIESARKSKDSKVKVSAISDLLANRG